MRNSGVLIGAALLAAGCGPVGRRALPVADAAPADRGRDLAADRSAPALDAASPDVLVDLPPAVDVAAPDTAPGDVASSDAGAITDPSLPRIHDHSGAPPARVLALVRAALAGLGFDPARGEGPNPDDRVFVGRFYLAWIDETGFHGKLNGLWTLNGAAGDALDFVHQGRRRSRP